MNTRHDAYRSANASTQLQHAVSRSLPAAKVTSTLIISASLMASCQLAMAQNSDDPQIQEMLITERSIENTLPLELARYGADLEIVTEQQIRNHGFVDVAQALEMLVPGLSLTTQAGAFSYVNVAMQGSRSSDILWTVDGVRINNRLYNSTSPADTLPSSMIERTEVLKGSHGLMYGTQAIAGVINVVTRGFSETPDGQISVGAGSDGLMRINGYGRGAIGDHKLVGWASRDESDGYDIYDNYQPTSQFRKRGYKVDSAGVKYGYDFTPDLSLSLTGIHTEGRIDYPNVSNISINDRTENIISARLDWLPSEAAQFFLKSYYHSWDTDYYTPGNASDYWGYEDKGVNAAAVFKPEGFLEYHVGYDFQTYTGQDDYLLIARQREDVHAVFTQLRSTDDLSDRARFSAGFRRDETGGNSSNTWNVTGVYEFTDTLYVKGMTGTSFMLPSAENLYRIHCPSGSGCTHGNPNLAPEESFAINASVGGLLALAEREIGWQVSVWDRSVDNLITRAPIPAGMPNRPGPEFDNTFINIGEEVEVRGAELLLNGELTSTLSYDLSYTYSQEEVRNTGQQIQDRPPRSYKGALAYSAPSGRFGANVAFKYIGRKSSDVNGFGLQYYGDNHVLDMGAHLYLDRDQQHRLTLRLENLLDEDYASSLGSAVLAGSNPSERFLWQRLAPPRTVHLNYSYNF
ncbi:TonB-dependent receptor plug domain-containing protein [Pseudohongiella sp. O18]|uniref:TonB-dependent receptor plug domain-containing protein n=1 Tax=Pseudohongiella sp. O18 TaxID=2904248 RepID=UPI001F257133|nr:TonB-dependent receptor [Pseudohongiella sp. O18]